MTKKILYFVLLSVLIMSVGYDIQTGRIQFGSSRINDSTSALMTMNKGLLINGDLYTPDAGKFYIGDNYLNGLANNMGYYSTTHTFYTQDGTTIATFDSAGGVTIADNLTADTLKGNGTQITGAKSGYVFFQTLSNNYADGVTYYLGNIAVAPSTAGGNRKLYFNRACKIKGIALNASVLGTLGTAENVAIYLRKNDTSDETITTTAQWTAVNNYTSSTALTTTIAAGDYIEIKIVAPTWATNPTTTYVVGNLYIE